MLSLAERIDRTNRFASAVAVLRGAGWSDAGIAQAVGLSPKGRLIEVRAKGTVKVTARELQLTELLVSADEERRSVRERG